MHKHINKRWTYEIQKMASCKCCSFSGHV